MGPIRLLYIGAFPPPEGGVRVLVRQLAEGLRRDDRFELSVVDLTTPPGWPTAAWQARSLARVARRLRRADLVMMSAPGIYMAQVAPAVAGLARAAGVPWVMRLFAGSQRQAHRARPAWHRALLEETVFAGAGLFVETRADVDWFAEHVRAPVHWLPNHRPLPDVPRAPASERARRFLFLGSVEPEKGIHELIAASEALAAEGLDLEVHIHGPERMDIAGALRGATAVSFGGLLPWERVYDTLSEHDALVLPSYREGYPGVLIEAFMVGLPVIATRLEGICEMTVEGTDSLLVEPGDVQGLTAAMRRVHDEPDTLATLREGAWAARDRFSAETWNQRVADLLVEAAAGRD